MHTPNHTTWRSTARGVSLVELLIAITLGLLVTAGMVQLFNSSKITFRTNDALARVQENGRFALETLKRELRESGSLGFCAGRVEIDNHLRQDCGGGVSDLFDANRSLVGWEFDGTGRNDPFTLPDDLDPASASAGDWESSNAIGSLPTGLPGLVSPGSDVLVVRRLTPLPNLTAVGNTPQNNSSINLTGAHGLPDDSLVLVTNCSFGDLFQNRTNSNATSFSAGSGSCTNPGPGNDFDEWAVQYDNSMQALSVTQVAYFVSLNADGEPGLFRWNMSAGTSGARLQELVEGVETMQILYGFSEAAPDGDGRSIDSWVTADDIPDGGWGQVIAIRLSLSVRSPETADFDNTDVTFDLSETDVTVRGDGRIRQPFTTTIALRNRVIVI